MTEEKKQKKKPEKIQNSVGFCKESPRLLFYKHYLHKIFSTLEYETSNDFTL